MYFPSEFILPTFISISIGILFTALLYMLGNLSSRKEVIALARENLTELSTIFMFIIFAFAFFGVIHNVTPGMLGLDLRDFADPSETGFDVDYDKLTPDGSATINNLNDLPLINLGEAYLILMYHQAEKLYRSMLITIGWMELANSITVGSGGSDVITPFKGFEPLLNMAPSMLTSSSLILMTLSAQLFMLKFFVYLVPTVLFPMGILFRALLPTKSFGSALIALCFTMYFVYPLVLSFNLVIAVRVLGSTNVQLDSIIYNAPVCQEDDECNSLDCRSISSTSTTKYCSPCILSGDVPEGLGGEVCCAKVSLYNEEKNSCDLKSPGDLFSGAFEGGEDEDIITKTSGAYGKGGIISTSRTPENMILVTFTSVVLGLLVMAGVGLFFPAVAGIMGMMTGLLSLAGIFTSLFFGFMFKPTLVFMGLVLLNFKFFFIGFILPAVQFVIMVEFVRVFTGSMGESINIMDLFKVI